MVRPREFDRDEALQRAMEIFWSRGFAATSTDDLLQAMNIGRQSLYNAFGDKRTLYLEALSAYQRKTTSGHLRRLSDPASALEGIRALLMGLIAEDDRVRCLGCMGVGSVGEFGTTDAVLMEQRAKVGAALGTRITERIREGQAGGEVDNGLDAGEASAFIQVTMTGLQLAARAGGGLEELRAIASFATDRLRAV